MTISANYVKSAKMVRYITFFPTLFPSPPLGGAGGGQTRARQRYRSPARGGVGRQRGVRALRGIGRRGAGPARDRAEGWLGWAE